MKQILSFILVQSINFWTSLFWLFLIIVVMVFSVVFIKFRLKLSTTAIITMIISIAILLGIYSMEYKSYEEIKNIYDTTDMFMKVNFDKSVLDLLKISYEE